MTNRNGKVETTLTAAVNNEQLKHFKHTKIDRTYRR